MKDVVICGAKRTPMGGFGGALGSQTAPQLGSVAIAAAINDSGLETQSVDETLMGIVLPAGVGQAPARQACIAAGLDHSVPCTAISKVCGSGMQAVRQAHMQIAAGLSSIVIAGGMESMSNAPYLAPKMRHGARLGHGRMLDHMFFDGLEDAYSSGALMGKFAEDCADKYQFSRAEQDGYALASLSRAQNSAKQLRAEIAPVEIMGRNTSIVTDDEQPSIARPDKIPQLKPAFRKDGTVTAANASSISDGAAAIVLADRATAKAHGAKVRARIRP